MFLQIHRKVKIFLSLWRIIPKLDEASHNLETVNILLRDHGKCFEHLLFLRIYFSPLPTLVMSSMSSKECMESLFPIEPSSKDMLPLTWPILCGQALTKSQKENKPLHTHDVKI